MELRIGQKWQSTDYAYASILEVTGLDETFVYWGRDKTPESRKSSEAALAAHWKLIYDPIAGGYLSTNPPKPAAKQQKESEEDRMKRFFFGKTF